MSRLEEVKNEYLKQTGFNTWTEMSEYYLIGDVGGLDAAIQNVAVRYATECVNASISVASKNLEMTTNQEFLDWLKQQNLIEDISNIKLL